MRLYCCLLSLVFSSMLVTLAYDAFAREEFAPGERAPVRHKEVARDAGESGHPRQVPVELRDAYRGQKEYSDSLADVIQQFNAHIRADSIQATMQSLEDFGTRFALAENRKEVAEWIKGRFMDVGYTQARLDSFPFNTHYQGNYYETMQYNVVITYEGHQNPDSVLVIGAHYDSIVTDFNDTFEEAPGADDNASGVAAALEIARILKTHGYAPAYTIKFVLFAAEELGLHGAWDYADKASAQGMDIYCMINNDMIGYTTQMPGQWTVNMQTYPGADWYTNLAQYIIGNHTSLQVTQNSQFIQASDSWAFHQNGFNAVFFIEDEFNPYYHTVNDLVIHTNKHFVAEVTKASLGMLIYLNGSGHTDTPLFARWDGSADSDWHNAANWNHGLLPAPNTAVQIDPGAHHEPVLNEPATIGNLHIPEDASLVIGRGGALRVADEIVNEAGPPGLTLDAEAGTGDALPVLIHDNEDVMARIKQYMDPYPVRGVGLAWHWLASPVAGQDIEDFVSVLDGAGFDLARWDEPGDQWLYYDDDGGPPENAFAHTEMLPGTGYVLFTHEPATFAWEGPLHVQDFSWENLSNQGLEPGDPYPAGKNLVGNPWASGILVDLAFWSSPDASVELTPQYRNEHELELNFRPYRKGAVIPPQSAFYLQVVSPGAEDASLTIDKDARTQQGAANPGDDYIVLAAEELSLGIKQHAYVRLNEHASAEYDHRFDATFTPHSPPYFHTSKGERPLLVHSLPELHEDLVIPYHIGGLYEDMQYAIHLKENLEDNALYLEDLATDSIHPLDLGVPYVFEKMPDAGPQRFVLHFGMPDDPTSIPEVAGPHKPGGRAWVHDRTLYLEGWSGPTTLHLVDLTGRTLARFTTSRGLTSHSLSLPAGVYVLTSLQDPTFREKLIVQ